MFFRHSIDKLIYPLILIAALIFVTYRPKYHLRSDMPADFFRPSASSTAAQRSLDQKVAWAYWESAQMDIQWKYPHGQTLPPDPVAEFRVDARALGPDAADQATRVLYWHRLQQVWYVPATWQKEYGWDFTWASDPLSSAGEWLREKADQITRF
jgi:hypothetical protein